MEEKELEQIQEQVQKQEPSSLADGLGAKIVDALQNQVEVEPEIEQEVKPQPREVATPSAKISGEKPSVYKNKAINISSENYVLSDNISKLINLINDLPEGVSKQVGATIIKQTMEAMGVSMKTLMAETKEVQENINGNIRNYMGDIEEAKAHIRKLEEQIKAFKNLSDELNDLMGLFIVSDAQ